MEHEQQKRGVLGPPLKNQMPDLVRPRAEVSLEKKTMVGFGLAFAILMAVGFLQYRNIQLLVDTDGWVAQTHTVLTELQATYADLQRAESGTRGYIATGQEDYLRLPVPVGMRSEQHLHTLRSLISDNPRQEANFDKLALLMDHKVAVMQQLVAIRRNQGFAAASQQMATLEGLKWMGAIRTSVDAMEAEENRLLVARQAASRASASKANEVIAFGTLLALTFVLVAGWIANRDAAQRRRAEEALQRASAYNRSLIEASLDPLVTIAPNGRITDISTATEKVTGHLRQELIGTDFLDYFTEPERARAGYQRVFQDGAVKDYALEIRHRDGHTTPVLYNASVYRDEAGKVTGVFAAARDITERICAEQVLRQQATLFDQAYDAMLVWPLHGPITFWNRGAERLYGYSPEEAIGRVSNDLLQTTTQGGVQAFVQALDRDGRWEGELEHTTRDGRRITVETRMMLLRDPQGARVLETNRDITARKRAEEALRLASAYNRILIETSLDPLITIAPDGIITDVNTATERITGAPRQELIGTDFSNYFTDPEKARSGYQQVFKEGWVQDYALEVRHRDRHTTPVLYNASVYRDERGEVVGVFAAARDITERKRAEEEVRKLTEQLEQRVAERTSQLQASNQELEAFTYSVSHDLRAPLRHIDGFSKLLVEHLPAELSTKAQEYVAIIRESVHQMGVLIDDLLNLGRVGRTAPRVQVTGLNSIVQEVIANLSQANPQRAIEWKVQTLPFVECDPTLMKQVFANLLSNAVKFTRPRAPANIEVGATQQDGSPVVFVRDNGVGFSMRYVSKLFGVFQRLHRAEDFEGTGVGLATVQRIIHKHGGRVWAEAALDKGATFYFTLGSPDNSQLDTRTNSGGNP